MTSSPALPAAPSAASHVSLVIPTWNEADWLPRLLESARSIPVIRQVVVADKASPDGTAAIALAAGCTIADGGRPSAARNHGAALASEDILLFTDADCVLTADAVNAAVEGLDRPGVVGFHVRTVPVSLDGYCQLSYRLMDLYLRALAACGLVQGVASFIAVRREAFEACGGFDERVTVGEDADFLRRLSARGRVLYRPDQIVFTSARRFHSERPWLFSAKVFMWATLRLLHLKRSIVEYRWDGHARTAADEAPALAELLQRYRARPAPTAASDPMAELMLIAALGEAMGEPPYWVVGPDARGDVASS